MVKRSLAVAILAVLALGIPASTGWSKSFSDAIGRTAKHARDLVRGSAKAVGSHHLGDSKPHEGWKLDSVIDQALEPGPSALSRCNTKPVPDDCP